MDLFNGPVGTNQIHDYNPHITNGVFWTIFVPPDSVDVHLGAGQASFRLTTPIFDDHDLKSSLTGSFPAGFPQAAEVTFDVEWSGIVETAQIRNETLNFEGYLLKTGSTIQWSAQDPSSGFRFTSEAPNPARLVNAVIGHERNGVFFE